MQATITSIHKHLYHCPIYAVQAAVLQIHFSMEGCGCLAEGRGRITAENGNFNGVNETVALQFFCCWKSGETFVGQCFCLKMLAIFSRRWQRWSYGCGCGVLSRRRRRRQVPVGPPDAESVFDLVGWSTRNHVGSCIDENIAIPHHTQNGWTAQRRGALARNPQRFKGPLPCSRMSDSWSRGRGFESHQPTNRSIEQPLTHTHTHTHSPAAVAKQHNLVPYV